MNVPPSSNLIFAVHPRWSAWLLLDDQNKRLNNIERGKTASFAYQGQSIHIKWDSAGEETFHFLDGFYVYAEMMPDYLSTEQQRFASERLGVEPWKPKTNYDLAKQQVVQGRLSICMDAVFGKNVFIAEDAKIFTNWLRMGEGSWIASAALLRHSVSIGPRSGINYGVVIAGKVAIGTDTHIASGTAIYGFNHNFLRADIPVTAQGSTFKGIVIGDDVWIGANAVIMDGVRVGSHSVVAAGAVVTKNVPEFHLVAGVPAKTLYDKRDVQAQKVLVASGLGPDR